MKKTNFTIHEALTTKLTLLLVMLLISFTGINLNAQCSLACNGTTNVSLDNDCEAMITPEMILNDNATSCPGGAFSVIIMEEIDGDAIPTSPVVTGDYVGQTLFVKVQDDNSNNSCWGEIFIEDKIAPTIECPIITAPVLCFNSENLVATPIDNCDPNPELILVNETITVNDCTNPANNDIIKTIERTYIARDASGMTSEECSFSFDVVRLPSLDMIDAPVNYILDNSLECSGSFPRDAAGNPDVSFTGVPTLDGTPLYPNPYVDCNLVVTKEDVPLPPIGCVEKLMRIFTVVEWACGEQRSREIVQMIEIADNEGPVITQCPSNFIASTSNYECSAVVLLPPVEAMDLCSDNIEVDISYPGGFLDNQNGGLAEGMLIGENIVTYTVYDECLNSSTCSIIVTVEDLTPPVAVCDQFTAVGLTNDGYAHVSASVFDDGSYDECQLERMLVRRMDTDNCGECEAPEFTGFTSLGKFNGHYYFLSDKKLTGRMAAKHSIAMGGYGVSTESGSEFSWLNSVVPDDTDFYIGLGNNGGDTYSWASGANLTTNGWAPGEPSDNDPYVIYNSALNRWDDVDGYTEYRYVIEIAEDCWYSEYTKFCCDDIGEDNMVVFRVIDAACNFNECMVNVDVQDKIGPVVACPADVTVSCDTPYDVNNLSQFGEPQVFDNCGFEMEETVTTDFDQCQTGDLVRTFTVTDDGGRVSTCSQTITFEFDYDLNGNAISFPANVTMNDGCDDPNSSEYDPINTGLPVYPDVPCQLLGLNIDDQVFLFNGNESDACFKILRTFTVINWCETDANGIPETYVGTQVIKVNNDVAPVIDGDCERVTVCTYDAECQDGAIELMQSASDDCTSELSWSYSIDANNDGTLDITRNGDGNMADASGTYPIGSHRVIWTFFDRCGNATTCEQLFDVVNCKAPTPYCLNGLAIDLMPSDTDGDGTIDGGMIDIWAKDFDAGSAHPCGYDVVLSFSPDTTETSMFFFCEDVGEQEVMIYTTSVTPSGELLQAFCITYVDVQDNMNACGTDDDNGTGNKPVVEGHISTVHADMLNDVRVDLVGNETIYEMTNEGAYAFPEMPTGGDYVVDPFKNDDVNNGVSTLDLVMIQRHVVGLEDLEGAHNLIAADINKDEMISALDIVDLRKVILGVNDTFTGNDSWRFIDANYIFADPTNPWTEAIPESYSINNLDEDMIVDFTAIKVGDVNNSVEIANAVNTSSEVRSSRNLMLEADMTQATDGELATIPVMAKEAVTLAGAQMTINLGVDVTFAAVEAAVLDITDANVGLRYADRGIITISWDNTNGVSAKQGDVLFNLVIASNQYDNNTLAITSDITKAEAFDMNDEVMDVELSIRDNAGEGFALMQNTPNPFNNFTEISFKLPAAMNATLTVYDVNGRILRTISSKYDQGNNTIRLEKSELGASGILYYQLQAGDYTANRKMVVFN